MSYEEELSLQIDLQLESEGKIIPSEQSYSRLESEKLNEKFQVERPSHKGNSYLLVEWTKTIMGPNYKVSFLINHDFVDSKGSFYLNKKGSEFWNLVGKTNDQMNNILDIPVDSFTIFRYLFSGKHPSEIIKGKVIQ